MFTLLIALIFLVHSTHAAARLAPRVNALDVKLAHATLNVSERALLRMHTIADAHGEVARLLDSRGHVVPHLSEALSVVERRLATLVDDVYLRARRECANSVATDPCLEASFDLEYAHCFVHRVCAPDAHRNTLPCTALRMSAVQSQLLSLAHHDDPLMLDCVARARDLPCLATLYDAPRDVCWELDTCRAGGECADELDRVANGLLAAMLPPLSDA